MSDATPADDIATVNYLRYEDTHIGCNIPWPTIVLTTKHNKNEADR